MSIFEKSKKTSKKPSVKKYSDKKYYKTGSPKTEKNKIKKQKIKPTKIKKRKKIGFRPPKTIKTESEPVQEEQMQDEIQKTETWEITDDGTLDLLQDDEKISITSIDKEKTDDKTLKKKKTFIKKDMKGKPVFLEDTGEKLGIVFDSIYDKKNNLVGYKIKDKKSDAVLSFPLDQFDHNKDGLIFAPGWYTNAMKIIEKLEFKDKISPELTALFSDDAVSNKELYDIFLKHDDDMANYIEDAVSLTEILNNRLKVLEKHRLAMKDELIDLTEKRLIKDIDRREFSQDVIEHRRKVNILDVNINKCRDLMKRLDTTSFGMLGKEKMVEEKEDKSEEDIFKDVHREVKEKKQPVLKDDIKDPYKEKYYSLKERFNQLEEEYQELKSSVEKLFSKNEF
jgi:hypothetical protein